MGLKLAKAKIDVKAYIDVKLYFKVWIEYNQPNGEFDLKYDRGILLVHSSVKVFSAFKYNYKILPILYFQQFEILIISNRETNITIMRSCEDFKENATSTVQQMTKF